MKLSVEQRPQNLIHSETASNINSQNSIQNVQSCNDTLPTQSSSSIYQKVAEEIRSQLNLNSTLTLPTTFSHIPIGEMDGEDIRPLLDYLLTEITITGKDNLLSYKTTLADFLLDCIERAKVSTTNPETGEKQQHELLTSMNLTGSATLRHFRTHYLPKLLKSFGVPNPQSILSLLETKFDALNATTADIDFAAHDPEAPDEKALGDHTRKLVFALSGNSKEQCLIINKKGLADRYLSKWQTLDGTDNPSKYAVIGLEQKEGPKIQITFFKTLSPTFIHSEDLRFPLKALLEAWKTWVKQGGDKETFLKTVVPSLHLKITSDRWTPHQGIIDYLTGTLRPKLVEAFSSAGYARLLSKRLKGMRTMDEVFKPWFKANKGSSQDKVASLYKEICDRAERIHPHDKLQQHKTALSMVLSFCSEALLSSHNSSKECMSLLISALVTDQNLQLTLEHGSTLLHRIYRSLKDKPESISNLLGLLTLNGFQCLCSENKNAIVKTVDYLGKKSIELDLEGFKLHLSLDMVKALGSLLIKETVPHADPKLQTVTFTASPYLPDASILDELPIPKKINPLTLDKKLLVENNIQADSLIAAADWCAKSTSPLLRKLALPLHLTGWAMTPDSRLDRQYRILQRQSVLCGYPQDQYDDMLASALSLVREPESLEGIKNYRQFLDGDSIEQRLLALVKAGGYCTYDAIQLWEQLDPALQLKCAPTLLAAIPESLPELVCKLLTPLIDIREHQEVCREKIQGLQSRLEKQGLNDAQLKTLSSIILQVIEKNSDTVSASKLIPVIDSLINRGFLKESLSMLTAARKKNLFQKDDPYFARLSISYCHARSQLPNPSLKGILEVLSNAQKHTDLAKSQKALELRQTVLSMLTIEKARTVRELLFETFDSSDLIPCIPSSLFNDEKKAWEESLTNTPPAESWRALEAIAKRYHKEMHHHECTALSTKWYRHLLTTTPLLSNDTEAKETVEALWDGIDATVSQDRTPSKCLTQVIEWLKKPTDHENRWPLLLKLIEKYPENLEREYPWLSPEIFHQPLTSQIQVIKKLLHIKMHTEASSCISKLGVDRTEESDQIRSICKEILKFSIEKKLYGQILSMLEQMKEDDYKDPVVTQALDIIYKNFTALNTLEVDALMQYLNKGKLSDIDTWKKLLTCLVQNASVKQKTSIVPLMLTKLEPLLQNNTAERGVVWQSVLDLQKKLFPNQVVEWIDFIDLLPNPTLTEWMKDKSNWAQAFFDQLYALSGEKSYETQLKLYNKLNPILKTSQVEAMAPKIIQRTLEKNTFDAYQQARLTFNRLVANYGEENSVPGSLFICLSSFLSAAQKLEEANLKSHNITKEQLINELLDQIHQPMMSGKCPLGFYSQCIKYPSEDSFQKVANKTLAYLQSLKRTHGKAPSTNTSAISTILQKLEDSQDSRSPSLIKKIMEIEWIEEVLPKQEFIKHVAPILSKKLKLTSKPTDAEIKQKIQYAKEAFIAFPCNKYDTHFKEALELFADYLVQISTRTSTHTFLIEETKSILYVLTRKYSSPILREELSQTFRSKLLHALGREVIDYSNKAYHNEIQRFAVNILDDLVNECAKHKSIVANCLEKFALDRINLCYIIDKFIFQHSDKIYAKAFQKQVFDDPKQRFRCHVASIFPNAVPSELTEKEQFEEMGKVLKSIEDSKDIRKAGLGISILNQNHHLLVKCPQKLHDWYETLWKGVWNLKVQGKTLTPLYTVLFETFFRTTQEYIMHFQPSEELASTFKIINTYMLGQVGESLGTDSVKWFNTFDEAAQPPLYFFDMVCGSAQLGLFDTQYLLFTKCLEKAIAYRIPFMLKAKPTEDWCGQLYSNLKELLVSQKARVSLKYLQSQLSAIDSAPITEAQGTTPPIEAKDSESVESPDTTATHEWDSAAMNILRILNRQLCIFATERSTECPEDSLLAMTHAFNFISSQVDTKEFIGYEKDLLDMLDEQFMSCMKIFRNFSDNRLFVTFYNLNCYVCKGLISLLTTPELINQAIGIVWNWISLTEKLFPLLATLLAKKAKALVDLEVPESNKTRDSLITIVKLVEQGPDIQYLEAANINVATFQKLFSLPQNLQSHQIQ